MSAVAHQDRAMARDQSLSPGAVHELTGQVLDGLSITDVAYEHFQHTRPLVDDVLVALCRRVDRGGRVLVVGGNSLLAQAILAAGYDLHLWRFGENLLADDLETRIRGRLTPDMLQQGRAPFAGAQFEAIVLPRILEHVRANPARVLASLRSSLGPTGVLIVATQNLSALGRRVRAIGGKPHLPGWHRTTARVSLSWPSLPACRFYTRAELVDYASQAELRTIDCVYSLGHHAIDGAAPPTAGRYVALKLAHWAQRAAPSLRDYVVLTLERAITGKHAEDPTAAGGDGGTVGASFPLVSVVLPTHNRSALLRDSFAGLLEQTYPADRFEVVLVDDNSTDDTEDVARELTTAAPFSVQYLKTAGIGATAARNLGMREARGEIVAHLDDDNRPVPGWLEEGVLGFSDGVAIVGGPVTPKPEQFVPFLSFTAYYQEERGVYPSSNVFFRRDVALAAGGFDESFGRSLMGRPVWGWDSDLAWRLRRAGYRSRFRAGVVAYQEVVRQQPRAWLLEGWRMVVLPTTVKRVPELGQSLLVHRFFADEASFRFDLALAGAVLALVKRHPAPLVLALPYATLLAPLARGEGVAPWRWPRLGLKVGFTIARHGITFLGLLVGSAQAKRLVL